MITCNRGVTIISLGGDCNFNTMYVPPGSHEAAARQSLLVTLQNQYITQMQKEPTRQDSVLDLYITNRPYFVKKKPTTIPGISDYEGFWIVTLCQHTPKISHLTPLFSQEPIGQR